MAVNSAQLYFDFFDDTVEKPVSKHPVKKSDKIISFPLSPSLQNDIVSFFPEFNFPSYGSWVDYGKRLSATERLKINNNVIALLKKSSQELSPDDLSCLRSYSGWGGLSADNERGVLYDYYTSPPVASLTWRLLHKIQPIHKNCRILEPSCGTGVFFAVMPAGVSLDGVELDERSAAVASRLHPGVHIVNKSYEAFNISLDNQQFDHIIGNAPFGDRSGKTAFMDMRDEKSLDRYFISRSLNNLKAEGTMGIIVHPGIMANSGNIKWRLAINLKAQFMGAVKLNDDSFNHTHTSIQPDILFFKKHPLDIQERLQTFSFNDIDGLQLAQKDWINGFYFDAHPDHVMGIVKAKTGQWGSDVISGKITPETIKSILDAFIPEKPFGLSEYNPIREVAPLQAKSVKTSNLVLSKEETKAVEQKALSIGSIKNVKNSVYVLTDLYRWKKIVENDPPLVRRLEWMLTISRDIRAIRQAMWENRSAESLQGVAKTALNVYKELHGNYPKDDARVTKFLRNNPSISGIYDALIDPGSAILSLKNLYTTQGDLVNGHNRAIEALLFLQQRMIEGTAEAIKQYFPEEAEALIEEMRRNPDIFLAQDCSWQLREDFLSGNAWHKIDKLKELASREANSEKRDKWQYGIAELEKAVGWIPIEDADFSPHSSWIPEDIINQWARDEDGLNRSFILERGNLSKNDKGKWGIRYADDYTIYEHGSREGREVKKGQWEALADEIVYYLNMQKQRSRYLDTEVYNREHNDSFKNYIANHAERREELENKYNRIFNTEIGVPVKTYPVCLEDWRAETKSLKPHQWQSVHHLYREGKGISALGTGFGKTLAAIALHALLKQEGRVNRAWFQVPNNKIKDWIKEIHDVLPERSIGYVDPEMPEYSSRDKRYTLYQELADNAYDIILMPESSAGEIQLSPEQDAVITEEVISKHIAEKGETISKRQKETIKENVARKMENGKTNHTICFEDFGCNAIFVDEAHRYKNLFSSNLSRETGMNDGRQSAKALSLFKKTEYIRRSNNGKNVYFFTATPLTNSPLEYHNMLMYIAPEELERFGIHTIDSFIKNFADIEIDSAYDWQNGTIAQKKVLKGFKNIQALQNLFFRYTDYQNDPEKINLEKPDAHNTPNVIPLNAGQTGVMQSISAELERYKELDKEERRKLFPGQNFLTFYSQMRTASLDLELYDPVSYRNWQNPKLTTLARNVWNSCRNTGGGQVVFCDRVFSSDMTFNIHNKIKLILCKTGFRDNEIVIINGFTKSGGTKSDSLIEKEVSQAVAAFNRGVYKVIIGSTACIGEGLNLQENSAALHHFDIPFRPSDFIQRNGRIDRQGNSQLSVELHTYMSAGTIDNYSVSLVQRKANWIDQLLRTKSNVFVNPNDENYVDAEELLLALTEEWGNAEQADERRKEIEHIKAKKEEEAKNHQRKNNLASLSLMRNSLCGFTGDTGSISYQNRIRKIAMLEKLLKDNPTFKEHNIIAKNIPFLYEKTTDSVIRNNDSLIRDGIQYVIVALNFKKQEFTARPLNTPEGREIKDRIIRIYDFKDDDDSLIHISQPGKEERSLIKVLHNKAFYQCSDIALKERYYVTHLHCAYSQSEYKPVIFTINDEGGLLVKKLRYYYRSVMPEPCFNPYSEEDLKTIHTLSQLGIAYYDNSEREEYLTEIATCFPELYSAIRLFC
jgi:hypothetical protein